MTGDSNSILGEERASQLSVLALDQQIAEHKKADDNRSVLSWAVSQIWRRDEGSLDQLQALSKEVHEAEQKGDTARVQAMQSRIDAAVKGDKDEVGLQSEISHYAGGGLKTAALFFGGSKAGFLSARGGMGLAATVGLYGLDEAKVNDDAGSFAANFALGGAKGGLTKGLFHQLGGLPIESPALKGIVLGLGARTIDTGLTGSNYINAEGKFDFGQGLGKLGSQLTDTRAMVMDGLLFSAAHGMTRGANWLTNGAVDARPMYNTVLTSASFGLSGGAYHELDRQVKAGEQIDFGKIVGRAALQGTIDAFAGIPGGLNADVNFRTRPVETLKQDGAAIRERFTSVRDNIAERFGFLKNPLSMENLGFGASPRPAFAFAMSGMSEAPVADVKVTGRDLSGNPPRVEQPAMVEVDALPEHQRSTVPERKQSAPMSGEGEPKPVESKPETVDPKPETVDPKAERESLLRAAAEAKSEPAYAREYPPEDVAKAQADLDTLTEKYKDGAGGGRREPTQAEVNELIDYLKDHPEADNYATKLYVRNFANPVFRRALESFFKPPFAMENELALARPDVRDNFRKFETAMSDPGNRSILPEIWGKRINSLIQKSGPDGPAVRELIEHFGRTTYDAVVAKAVDAALGTKYAERLQTHDPNDVDGIHRQMPLTEADIAYVRSLAQGKPIPYPSDRVAKISGEVPSDIADGATALRPERLAAVEPEFETTSTNAERPRPSGFVPEYIAEAQAGIRESIMKDVEVMRTGTAEQQAEAATKLADQLQHDSAKDWFGDWVKQVGKTHVSAASELDTPAVQAVAERAPDAVLQFLRAEGTLSQSYRFRALSEIAGAFEGKPEIAEAVLRSAGNDPSAIRNIGYELTRGFARGAYAKWLEKQFTPAAEGDPVPSLTADQINGPNAMQAARIYGAFGEGPVAKYLSEFAAAQPEIAQELMKKVPDAGAVGRDGKPARGADFKQLLEEVVQRRIAEGTPPDAKLEQFNPDLLGMELRLKNAFRFNQTALDTLLTFARNNLDAVAAVIRMPGEQPQQQGGRKTGPPDRNDPAVKLSRAYTDFIGIIAPEAAKLGPEAGLSRLQDVQRAFADSIAKHKKARNGGDDPQLVRDAEMAERELNRLTNDLMPQEAEMALDAQRRREAIAKQDADLLPNRQPPRPGGGNGGDRGDRRPRDNGRPFRQEQQERTPPPVTEPTFVTDPTLAGEPKVETTPPVVEPTTDAVTTPPPELTADPRAKEAPPEKRPTDPPDLGIGPVDTIQEIQELSRRGNSGSDRRSATPPPEPRILDQAQLDLMAAEEAAREQNWRRRKGGNGDEEGDYGNGRRNGKKKGGGGGRPRDWRRNNSDEDWRNWEDE